MSFKVDLLNNKTGKVENKKLLFKGFSVVLSTLIGLLIVIYFLPFNDILRALKEISFKSFIVGLSLYTLSYWFRAYRWKFFYPEAPFKYLFFTTAVNTFFNNILPARLGESSIFVFLKKYDKSLKETLKKFFKVRLLDGFSILTFLVFALISLKLNPLVGFLIALPIYPLGIWILNAIFKVINKDIYLNLEPVPFLLSIGNVAAKLFAVYTVLEFINIGFLQFSVGFIGGELSSILPFHSFAGLGSYETAFAASLKLFLNENFSEGFKVAFLSHAFLLFSSILLGLISLLLFLKR